jgi:hypothetical protein
LGIFDFEFIIWILSGVIPDPEESIEPVEGKVRFFLPEKFLNAKSCGLLQGAK